MRYRLDTLLGVVLALGLLGAINSGTVGYEVGGKIEISGRDWSRSTSWFNYNIGWPWKWLVVQTDGYETRRFVGSSVVSWLGFLGSLAASLITIVLAAFLSRRVCGWLTRRKRGHDSTVPDQRPTPPPDSK